MDDGGQRAIRVCGQLLLARLEEKMDVLYQHGPIMADGETANSDEWERKQVDDCRNCTPRSARDLGTGRLHFRRNSRQIIRTLGGYMSTNCLPILLYWTRTVSKIACT